MHSRSNLIIRSVGALALTSTMLLSAGYSHTARAATTTTDLYIVTGGDTNVEALFRDTYIPDFEKAYPQYAVTYTNILHGTNFQGLVVNNLVAAKATHQKNVPYDIFEDSPLNYAYPVGSTYKDYFQPVNVKNVPNATKIDSAVLGLAAGYGIPYRSSAVVLAYNSQKVKTPPKTFADLIAWIQANPGKFTYCDPNFGGSGDSFVIAAIRSVMDPVLYAKLNTMPYNAANAAIVEKDWPKAWALLKSIDGDMFQNGFHPTGNLPVLNLLARGTINVATVWSDQSLDALSKGLLPKYIKLIQISPPFPGGDTFLSVPKLAQNPAAARAFINFTLTPAEQAKMAIAISGFPSIKIQYMPPAIIKALGAIANGYDTSWPGGQYQLDDEKLWTKNVPKGS
jgi:putative spermidine/putrescine transport system substrate-binding protein